MTPEPTSPVDQSPAAKLQRGAERPARLVKTVCQFILAAGLAIALIVKVYNAVLTDHVCAADATSLGNAIRCTPTLILMSYVLAISAGFDLAYRMFSDRLEQVTVPVTLGLGAATLALLSRFSDPASGWREALMLSVLLLGIGGAIWLLRGRRGVSEG